ncbi:Aste57867_19921 [Aphanomyces stellatus]|uniref:Aste57867_19921 protein n=1 Tax=Aphanomyces stellatus TaxID=120398 RepID=A0A485LEG0_9STRA|nr:hypothetical protein As57867_019855 [Aphanomyces stellatus]VFT96619.1 Aste57867_19921 [Aphanomyces stellatus]
MTTRNCMKRRRVKTVSFSVATTYTFHVAPSATAVPSDAIPGVGLHGPPIQVATALVSLDHDPCRSVVGRYSPRDRVYFMKRAGFSQADVTKLCLDHHDIQTSRKEAAIIAWREQAHADCISSKRACVQG